MRWSLKIAEFAGIGVFLHWTFLVLLAVLLVGHVRAGNEFPVIVEGIGFILALFGCVVLHEFGHALTARRYGISTRDITLLPIGGVARLERIPEEPWHEFWIAVAGPAVNVVLAAILFAILLLMGGLSEILRIDVYGGPFLAKLLFVNVMLVAFNMLPAFPMDGGRVLRSLLATRMPRVRATHIAAGIGQFMAMLFVVAGLLTQHWMLLFIALFVYLGAQGEAQAAEMNSIFRNVRVHDAMVTRFQVLSPTDPLQRAVDELLAGHQQDFPVMDDGRLAGILRRSELVEAIKTHGLEQQVGQVMSPGCSFVNAHQRLDEAVTRMQQDGCTTLPVEFQGRLVGLLTAENIGEWAMIHSALRDWRPQAQPQASLEEVGRW